MSLPLVSQYADEMRVRQYSPVTIKDRLAILHRFARFAEKPPATCTADDLRAFQASFAHLSPATVNVYTRHLKAFYDWAARRRLIPENPCLDVIVPRVPKGRPHPTGADDMRLIFSCTRGPLRIAYVLASFAGLRRGEICRLQRADMDLTDLGAASALIHGKGRKERLVPLIPPVVSELYDYGLPRTGWVVLRDGRRYEPRRLSVDSHYQLRALGVQTTLHSMRGAFATNTAQVTHDPLFVRDLLGHDSVVTTELYMGTTLNGAHERLAGLTTVAEGILGPARGHLRSVRDSGA